MAASSGASKNPDRGRHERIQQWKRIYEKWDLDAGKKLIFEPEPWLAAFSQASRTRDGEALRAMRLVVQNGTRAACTGDAREEFAYQLPSGERVVYCHSRQEIMDQIAASELLTFGRGFKWVVEPNQEGKFETEFSVVEGDCLEATEALLARGLNPAVLNMASDRVPGGGYRGGSGAQEENLFRRTNLLHVLANEQRWYAPVGKNVLSPAKFYPLPDPSVVYSPAAWVLRGSEANGYPWLETPYRVAFVAAAAYRRPQLLKDEEHMVPKMAEGFAEKVRAVLWTLAQKGHDSAVLSAWGCGAFRNPPLHIAEIFRDVLAEDWIKGHFRNITFAIFDDHNSRMPHNPEGNVKPFEKVFGTAKKASAPSASANTRDQAPSQAASSSSSSNQTAAPSSSSANVASSSATAPTSFSEASSSSPSSENAAIRSDSSNKQDQATASTSSEPTTTKATPASLPSNGDHPLPPTDEEHDETLPSPRNGEVPSIADAFAAPSSGNNRKARRRKSRKSRRANDESQEAQPSDDTPSH